MTLISDTSFDLLAQLAQNNTKDWYDVHKADIKTHCLTPFGELLEHVSNRLIDGSLPLEGSAKTMFRMNRDVRFLQRQEPLQDIRFRAFDTEWNESRNGWHGLRRAECDGRLGRGRILSIAYGPA